MRIISGEFGGRRLKAVPGQATRPTTDKVKEAIFNMIGPYFDGGHGLDLFAGSGGLGIEAISRGLDSMILVDRQYAAIKVIKENVATTKAVDRFQIIKAQAERAIQQFVATGQQFDLVLLDPPYRAQQIAAELTTFAEQKLLAPAATIVCETSSDTVLPEDLAGFTHLRRQTYGTTAITIYQYGGTSSDS
ncbi:16S rRNA (guanine(966)-N(2))-methyltransferase RsmD [Loigolactobacillus jiayinensis]|uniref:16S rRNA (Guanine(966)-N(2))-methyltransferase RsmD n=1 Tax=Loigolactobacillus jiayinensis TaxID=2486016 RepID=A0ABW1RCZ3_9LACO|nr:16S rRNA (guanine(966)-N(2))-methyltransferase RsmD [Loigolactobacillus jiayinensis]